MKENNLKTIFTNNLRHIFLIAFMSFSFSNYAQNDTLILKNNDRLIGEIKKMENGILTIETDYSDDDFTVKWIDIIKINSDQSFLITLTKGERYTSTISSEENPAWVKLSNASQEISIAIEDIVYIKPVKSSFKSRLDASISLGFNITKSNNLKQLTVRSNLGYTAQYWSLKGTFNSVRSNQDDVDEIKRTDGSLQFKYFLKRDKFALFTSEFLSNDEQRLKLRMTNRIGLGKYFIHSNRLYLGGGAGLAWTNETFYDSVDEARNSLEAFGAIEFNIFDMKNLDLLTSFIFYPSLSESKRIRLDYKIDLKYDLPWDLFVKLGLTYNYDNQPIEGASSNDYVFQTTFGWEL